MAAPPLHPPVASRAGKIAVQAQMRNAVKAQPGALFAVVGAQAQQRRLAAQRQFEQMPVVKARRFRERRLPCLRQRGAHARFLGEQRLVRLRGGKVAGGERFQIALFHGFFSFRGRAWAAHRSNSFPWSKPRGFHVSSGRLDQTAWRIFSPA